MEHIKLFCFAFCQNCTIIEKETHLSHHWQPVVTVGRYETRIHMSGFCLPPGDHELYMEWCVTGGVGTIRYRYFTVILTT